MTNEITNSSNGDIEPKEEGVELATMLSGPEYAKYGRFVFAALGGLPWVGGVLAAATALQAEEDQSKINVLVQRWLEEHRAKIGELHRTLQQMIHRLQELGSYVEERLQDERYLSLVRQGFRTWDEATTEEKRGFVRRCLTNAAATKLCSDDVIRLFLMWIKQYDEIHFRVMRILYKHPGSTRAEIWTELHGDDVREDSAEADLFKLLMRDLSTGSVLRQHRETNSDGDFLSRAQPTSRARTKRPAGLKPKVLESAFEDTRPYELTELGSQFLHYVVEELSPRIGSVGRAG
jgi:hypothetical protein